MSLLLLYGRNGAHHTSFYFCSAVISFNSISLCLCFLNTRMQLKEALPLESADIDDILDYICAVANKREVFFLWRPYLSDPKDDFILELAVEAQCDFVITYNKRDFKGIEKFGIEAATPKEFLQIIGELP